MVSASVQFQNANGHWFEEPSDAEVLERAGASFTVKPEFFPRNFPHSGHIFNSPVTDIEVGRQYKMSEIMKTFDGRSKDYGLSYSLCGITGAVLHAGTMSALESLAVRRAGWLGDYWGFIGINRAPDGLQKSYVQYSLSAIDNCVGRNTLWVVDENGGVKDKTDIRFIPNRNATRPQGPFYAPSDLLSASNTGERFILTAGGFLSKVDPESLVLEVPINTLRSTQDDCRGIDMNELKKIRGMMIGATVVSSVGAVAGAVATGANIHGAVQNARADTDSSENTGNDGDADDTTDTLSIDDDMREAILEGLGAFKV